MVLFQNGPKKNYCCYCGSIIAKGFEKNVDGVLYHEGCYKELKKEEDREEKEKK